MASLTGTKIKDTYDSLLKVSDNGALGASAKQITDGLGTGSPIYVSTGFVGIGTNTQTVNGEDLRIVGDVFINSTGSATVPTIAVADANSGIFAPSSGNIAITTQGTERMRIESTGKLFKYASAYTVTSSGQASTGIHIRATAGGSGLYGGAISFDTGSSGSSAIAAVQGSADSDVNGLAFFTHGSGTGSADATERMRIDSSGNVGIGRDPEQILHLKSANPIIKVEDSTTSGVAGGIIGKIDFWGNDFSGTGRDSRGFISSVYEDGFARAALVFASGPYNQTSAERMRITSGGYLKASNTGSYYNVSASYHELVSNASDDVADIVNTNANPFGTIWRFTGAAPNNTTNYFLNCRDNANQKFIVYSNGNVANTNNSYGAISDAKLKENVVDASPKLSDLMQVQVRNYNLIGSTEKQLGVVAQELETIFPSMISESPDFEEREVELRDENGEIVYETEQVLVSEEVAEVTEEVLHEAIAEELDEEGNVIVEAQEAWTETIIVTPFQEAVYETVTTDRPVMTTERVDLGTTTKSVKYSVFVPMLIKAIQELKAEVDALKGA